ncbi:MAG: FAD-binding oxidoreductase [Acidobacteria bacterium]|nr:FAD-binding oxidoreductase [Acidobacteriota bacterium]
MAKAYDIVVIGAGSVGVPAALALARAGLSVLVLDEMASPGQLSNKKAIGGIRATHSDFGKIRVCQRSIEIFAGWKEKEGDEIGWLSNGYSYPAYSAAMESKLKDLMKVQHGFGLNIRWVSPGEYNELVPGISMSGLRGSTYSPEDGSASPLLAVNAFFFKSIEAGAEYRFSEKASALRLAAGKIASVVTDKGEYACGQVINAAGNSARAIARLAHLDVPVEPDNHEGAITEPVQRFFGPMVVDIRPEPGSANYYFYQNHEGQVVFCITPDPPILGVLNESTSLFFPQVARRMVQLYPRLASLRVRRSWRGQYPMTPDGFPIVGRDAAVSNYIHAVGMCGQGFMLGPGLGELLTRIARNEETEDDRHILRSFLPTREFKGVEALK